MTSFLEAGSPTHYRTGPSSGSMACSSDTSRMTVSYSDEHLALMLVSAAMKMNVALLASLFTVAAARQLLQSTTARVTFFDNRNYSGGGQEFDATVPATGCGSCEDLVRLTPSNLLLIRTSPTSCPEQQRASLLS